MQEELKDGYYMSVYSHIDNLSYLLKVKLRHDQNISLWYKEGNNIELIHFWELERVTGYKKHSESFYSKESAERFINNLLSEYKIDLSDINEIWGTPGLDTSTRYLDVLKGYDNSFHSLFHMFSTILSDSELFYSDNILAFAVDAAPDVLFEEDAIDKAYYSSAYTHKGKINLENCYSPGRLWSYCKRKFNMEEGSLMALGSSLKVAFKNDMINIVKIENKNGYLLAKKYIDFLVEQAERVVEENDLTMFTGLDSNFSIEENIISMVIKVVKEASIKLMEYNIDNMLNKYDIDAEKCHLSLSGGFALNCPTNTYLMDKYKFKSFVTIPAVSDCGISIGIGISTFYHNMSDKGKINFKFKNAYYGNEQDEQSIKDDIEEYSSFIKNICESNKKHFLKDISDGPIVWISGRAEIGPRALAHRSILGDPTNSKTKNILNEIKQRQWWRPVSPIVLEEKMEKYFLKNRKSQYMLEVFELKDKFSNKLKSISHLDGSCRVQTLEKNDDPMLYEYMEYFDKKVGCAIVCNTSLNDKGEPIIDKLKEALNFALRKNIKIVYVNGRRIELTNHKNFLEDNPKTRETSEFNLFNDENKKKLLNKFNSYNLTKEEYTFYLENSQITKKMSINNVEDVRRIKKLCYLFTNKFGEVFEGR